MQRCRVGPRVADRTPQADVVDVGLRVVDSDLEVAVVVEDPRVEELVLSVEVAAPTVLVEQLLVGELGLRVRITPTHPRVCGGRVEIPPVLLRVFAMVAFVAVQAEDALLHDGIAPVPERECQAQSLLVVAQRRRARPRSNETPASARGRAGNDSHASPSSL